MFFILFFFFKSIKSHCKYTINVNKNVPLNYKFDLEETEFICINSTLPYLTVLFEPSQLLRINIYKETRNGQQFLKTMYTPGAYGGFDFSKEVGSMDIESILPGEISIYLFAFPQECSSLRYVTNLDADFFTLETKFENFQPNTTICMWYGSLHYRFKGKFLDGSKQTNEILVCEPAYTESSENSQRNNYFSNNICRRYRNAKSLPDLKNIYFKINPKSEYFITNYLFRFNSSFPIRDRVQVANVLDENQFGEIEIEESELIQANSRKKGYFAKENQNNPNNIVENETTVKWLVILFITSVIVLASLSIFVFTHFCIKMKRNQDDEESIPLLATHERNQENVIYRSPSNNQNVVFSRFYQQPFYQPQQQQYYFPPQQYFPQMPTQ